MIVTDDETIYRRALSFSNYGWIPDGVPYDHFMVASNYRMPELTAALIIGQISKVHSYARRRGAAIARLESLLADFETVRLQARRECTIDHGFFYFLIVFRNRFGPARDAVVKSLVDAGIPARRAYPSFHRTRMFRDLYLQCPQLASLPHRLDYASIETPVSDCIAEGGLWIPHWFFLEDDQIERLVHELRSLGVA
jgi:3-amino-5-hydroxybenzoate synthase